MTISELRDSRITLRVGMIALAWLVLISVLHAYLNAEPKSKQKILMGYMPVITNLAAPLIDQASRNQDVHFEALKFATFAEMSEAFRSGHIQVAFIIAPLAIAMYQQGVPLKVVYIGNRHESTLVVAKDLPVESPLDLIGKTVAVPIRYSGHLLALRRYLRQHGLDEDAIRTVEIPPPDMPAALAAGGVDGYFVGEPFASKAVRDGSAKRLSDVEEIWPNFICNLMIVQQQLIESNPQYVQKLVSAAVRSGLWSETHIDETIQVVSSYWGQDQEFVRYVFNNPAGRFRFDLYRPDVEELEEVAMEMRNAGFLNEPIQLDGLVDDRFVQAVDTTSVNSLQDILPE